MAAKYLDVTGLAYLWGQIKINLLGKVDKVDGKGLSTNDYTTAEQTKLSGIAAGAQANVLEGIQRNGSSITPVNKIVNIEVPTKVSDLTNDSGFVRSASPSLTGTPTAPTASTGTSTTQIATTAFVQDALLSVQAGAALFKGTVNVGTDISNLLSYKNGWYWVVGTAGTYVGEVCEPGDMIFCVSDYNLEYAASDFSVIQTNLDITSITTSEIDTILSA